MNEGGISRRLINLANVLIGTNSWWIGTCECYH